MVYLIVGLFILFDLATGLTKAFKNKVFTSSTMREGLFHKSASIFVVALATLVDYAQTMIDLGCDLPVTETVCTYIIVMEIGSVIENLGAINPNLIPENIKKLFGKLNESEVK